MSTPDLFRSRLDAMIDTRHPLAVLTRQLSWDRIEAASAPKFVRQDRAAKQEVTTDLLGDEQALEKNSFNLSDEELVERWSENVVW